MKGYKVTAIWMTGLLIGIFALSIGLSWYNFGYLDMDTVYKMGLLLMPIVGATLVVLVWPEPKRVREPATQDERKRISVTKSEKHVHA